MANHAQCNHVGCNVKVPVEPQYTCGNENKISCGKQFCDKHRFYYPLPDKPGRCTWLCEKCLKEKTKE